MFEKFDWSQIALFSGGFADFQHYEDVVNSVLAVVCVISAGLAAGLTMGLLSLDVTKLEIKSMTGSDIDRADAEAILPIVKRHHLLLVTLLLFNSMANEALPVFLSAILPEWLSVLISVTLVLVFGEILPSAFFTGKTQLHTAAIMIPFVKTLTFLFWPVGYPLSRCLDYVFGSEEETSLISREELGALVYLQNNNRSGKRVSSDAGNSLKVRSSPRTGSSGAGSAVKRSASDESFNSDKSEENEDGLSIYEINIMTGILKLAKLQVKDSMIKMKNVYMISDSTRLDIGTLERLWNCGFSRIPVFRRRDKQHIIGYLLIKSLILISADDKVPVETLPIRQPLFVKPNLRLLEMLSMFREGRCHMALVTEDPILAMRCMAEGRRPSSDRSSIIGIVTLEDVIEEIIQGEINDETDAMPSVFPIGSRTRPGGTSAMGILSMGRNSIMQKSAATRSILKIEEEEGRRLVKRSVSYANTYSTAESSSRSNSSSSGSSGYKTAHDHPPNHGPALKSWHLRSTGHRACIPDGTKSAFAHTHRKGSRGVSEGGMGEHIHAHYHALDSADEMVTGDVHQDVPLDDLSVPPKVGALSELHASRNSHTPDSYQLGVEGYRIRKSSLHIAFNDAQEKEDG